MKRKKRKNKTFGDQFALGRILFNYSSGSWFSAGPPILKISEYIYEG